MYLLIQESYVYPKYKAKHTVIEINKLTQLVRNNINESESSIKTENCNKIILLI